jgi:hypothetical protein
MFGSIKVYSIHELKGLMVSSRKVCSDPGGERAYIHLYEVLFRSQISCINRHLLVCFKCNVENFGENYYSELCSALQDVSNC